MLLAKIFVRFEIGFVTTKDNCYSPLCLDCFIQILMFTYIHYIFFEKCVYDTLYVYLMYMKLSRGNILTEYYIAQIAN